MKRQTSHKLFALRSSLFAIALAALPLAAAAVAFPDPFAGKSLQVIIGNVVRALLGISGSIALLMFLYGGFTWLTSQGEVDKIDTAKRTLTWAGLGLAVIFGSYVLVNFVITGLQQGPGAATPAASESACTCECDNGDTFSASSPEQCQATGPVAGTNCGCRL